MQINYKNNIVNIAQSLLKHYNLATNQATLPLLNKYLAKDYDHIAVILLDGHGSNHFTLHENETAFLKQHLKMELSSVFPATTTAATTAMQTGLTPYESGFLGWFQYFPKEDLHYTIFMNEDYYEPKKGIPKDFYDTYFKRETIFEKVNKHKLAKTKQFYPKKIDKQGYETLEEGLDRLTTFQKNNSKTLAYLYSIEPDFSSHHHGITSTEVKDALTSINDNLIKLPEKLPKNTLIILTADHGLVDVEAIDLFDYHDLTSTFEHLPAGEPRATQFFIKEGMHEHFINFFEEHFGQYFNLYTKAELLSKKLLGTGEPSELIDTCLGDFIAIAKDRYMFKLSDKQAHLAHHGGMSQGELIVPLSIITRDD